MMWRVDHGTSSFAVASSSRNADFVRRLPGQLDSAGDRFVDVLREGQLSDEEIGSPVPDRGVHDYFSGFHGMDDARQRPVIFCRCGDCDHVSELSPYPILSAMRRDNLFPRSYAFELLSKVRGAAAAGFVRRPELTSQQDSTAFVTT